MKTPKHTPEPKYHVFCSDFKEHEDSGQWRSYDLESEGNSLQELLANACYWQTDQDGGSLGDVPADDDNAESYIRTWFHKTLSEACRCHDDSGSCNACMERDSQ